MENNNDEILTFVLKQIYGENNDSLDLIQELKKDSNFLRLLNSLNIEYNNLTDYIKHIKEGVSMPTNVSKNIVNERRYQLAKHKKTAKTQIILRSDPNYKKKIQIRKAKKQNLYKSIESCTETLRNF